MKVATNRDETRPKVRLFHGSNVEVKKPSLRMGRKKTDFGRGFYTTTQKEQAEHWTLLTNPELKIREFNGPDEDWLNFVVDCRKGVEHDYDLVFGPVANDKVFTVVNLYESGVLDAPAAIAELKAYKTYNQLSFHSQRVIDALKFVESYEVKE